MLFCFLGGGLPLQNCSTNIHERFYLGGTRHYINITENRVGFKGRYKNGNRVA
jgi:hypothetical protein